MVARAGKSVRALLLASIIVSGAIAAPVTFNISISGQNSSGFEDNGPPFSGSFTYDNAAALGSQFTAFDVMWDGYTFDLTAAANAGDGNTLGCGTPNSADVFAFLTGTGECPGSPNSLGWFAEDLFGPVTYGENAIPPLSARVILFSFVDQGSTPSTFIYIDEQAPQHNSGPLFTAGGTFTITPSTPEPSTFILALTSVAFLVRRRMVGKHCGARTGAPVPGGSLSTYIWRHRRFLPTLGLRSRGGHSRCRASRRHQPAGFPGWA
jgi:hypothetical protein